MTNIPSDIERVRVIWCDVHGHLRSKTILRRGIPAVIANGIAMPGTQMLKDASDRTAFPVFDEHAVNQLTSMPELARFANASSMQLQLAETDPKHWLRLPWDNSTALVRADCVDGPWDTRRVLEKQVARLAQRGWQMRCGLEIEFHVYRLAEQAYANALDPRQAQWPGSAPELAMIHPGYRLLSDEHMSLCEPVMRCIERTTQALNLPLLSLEIEFGPSQIEAVFEVTDALTAADNMVLFRNIVRQALQREGYYASFVCRPPFETIMSSGWHLHQSLVDTTGANLFMPTIFKAAADHSIPLSDVALSYLAGQLTHAAAMTAWCVSQVNAYDRFRPLALAPQTASWGVDSRSAMLRVLGGLNDSASRIENRLGEPCANPYLLMAAQLAAGMAGVDAATPIPSASSTPIDLPRSLKDAITAMQSSALYNSNEQGFGSSFCQYFATIKLQEWQRFQAATDKSDFIAREYFARF